MMSRIATRSLLVAGDVHGALAELFSIAERLEAQHGEIVGVLQAGDLGAFGYESVLDKATRRFAAADPTELGVAPYIAGTLRAPRPLWFTRGNHEDFDLLERSGTTIDPWGELMHLPDGEVNEIAGVNVLAIGGVAGGADGDRAPRGGKFFRDSDVEKAAILCAGADIVLTHQGPSGFTVQGNDLAGSRSLLKLVEAVRPKWHFFGHHGHPPRPQKLGDSWIVPLNQPDVLRIPNRDGGIGLLDLDQLVFRFVMPDMELVSLEGVAAIAPVP